MSRGTGRPGPSRWILYDISSSSDSMEDTSSWHFGGKKGTKMNHRSTRYRIFERRLIAVTKRGSFLFQPWPGMSGMSASIHWDSSGKPDTKSSFSRVEFTRCGIGERRARNVSLFFLPLSLSLSTYLTLYTTQTNTKTDKQTHTQRDTQHFTWNISD